MLQEAGHDGYRLFAGFSAAGADEVTIYVASHRVMTSDGAFLEDNVEDVDTLTSDEIDNGLWVEDLPQDPGRHYLMLNAHTASCALADCPEGFSNVIAVTMPAKTLSGADARDDVEGAMSNGNLSDDWLGGYGQRITGCSRLSRLRVRCRVSWIVGDATFSGHATVQRRLGLDDRVRWAIRLTNEYCLATGGTECSRTLHGSYRP
jgi:hypothetical protein